ncbi:MAG TPA: ABC transporter ATP-binding protein [Leeuwenhoekiella sp.]|nr:ABC transporter ATP-binding protein [Leeuwenhoekiella sp.]
MLKVKINTFSYDQETVLQDMDFTVSQGQHISILGESGCGKSTLLQLIYGLLHLENGQIFWKENKLLGPNFNLVPGEPFIKYLAQDFDLMPYISVADNIAKFLSRNFMKERDERVNELLEVVDLTDFKNTHVKLLSGGQKQRVALARAIAKQPELLLLDEPFSHIDNFRRNALRRKLYAYLKKENITCITATHDSEEALSFSDEIKMMRKGTFIQTATPENLFKSPKNAYVASFFGDVNQLSGALFENWDNDKHVLLLPHQLVISAAKTPLQVTVKKSYFKGGFYLIEADFDGQNIYFNSLEPMQKDEKKFLKRSDFR